jgi:biopolymer transport protein ExbD
MKKCFLVLISFLFINCSNNEKLEGFWYGKRKDNAHPALLKFKENKLIDYSASYDTLKYSYSGDILTLKNEFNEKHNVKFKLENSKLILISPTSDSIISEFNKKGSNYFIKDLINDKSLRIDLPSGNSIQRMYGKTNLFEPLFISYQNGIFISDFRNEKIPVDKGFYKGLIEKEKYNFYEKDFIQIAIIGDKNIRIKDFELIKKQLKLANYNRVELILDNNKYEFIKSFRLKLPPLLEKDLNEYGIEPKEYILPPAPAKLDKEHTLLIEIGNNNIKINNVIVNEENLKREIQERVKTDSEFNVSYTFTDNSVYQDYINTFDLVYNSIIELRKDYLKKKYNIDYYSNDYDNRGKLKESKEKFRFAFFNIDNAEQ